MRRLIRVFVIIVLVLLALFLTAATLAAVFIQPNDYKPQIEAAVLNATGKTLNLNGDISLSLFPTLRLEAEGAELHDAAEYGMDPFLAVKKVKASVGIIPLLGGKTVISELLLHDFSLKLAVNQKGVPNWRPANEHAAPNGTNGPAESAEAVTTTSLAQEQAGQEKLPLETLQIKSLRLENATISYHDFGSGDMVTVRLAEANLDSLAPGQKTSLGLKGTIHGKEAQRSADFSLAASCTLPSAVGQDIPFTLSGSLDTDSVKGEGVLNPPSLSGERPFTLHGTFSAARLDLDRYIPADTDQPGSGTTQSGPPPVLSRAEKREAENLSRAKARSFSRIAGGLNLDIRLTAETLIVKTLPLEGVAAAIRAENGDIHASLAVGKAARGSFEGTATIKADGENVDIHSAGKLENARLEELLQALNGKASISGALGLRWDVTGNGVDWALLAPSLKGTAALALTNGAMPGFELIPAGVQGIPARRMDIAIQEFSASLNIADGVAVNKDLLLQSPGISATGGGRLLLPEQRIDWNVNISVPALPVVPARITGPVAAPSYTVDTVGLLRNAATGILNAPGQAGQGIGNVGQDIVRGILGK